MASLTPKLLKPQTQVSSQILPFCLFLASGSSARSTGSGSYFESEPFSLPLLLLPVPGHWCFSLDPAVTFLLAFLVLSPLKWVLYIDSAVIFLKTFFSCGTPAQVPCGMWDCVVPQPGIKPTSPALSLNPWITRKVPVFLKHKSEYV